MPSLLLAGLSGLLLWLAAAVGLLAWADASTRERLPSSVAVAGVELGGMTRPEAVAALRERLGTQLARPVRVRAAGRTFLLRSSRARVRADLAAAVDRLYAEGRRGSFIERGWRQLAGRERRSASVVAVEVDETAVRRFVRHVDRVLRLRGRRLADRRAMTHEIVDVLRRPGADRLLVARTARRR